MLLFAASASVCAWSQTPNANSNKLLRFLHPKAPATKAAAATKSHGWATADFPGANYNEATDLNTKDGTVVGIYSFDGQATDHGFTFKNGTYSSLDVPGEPFTDVWGTNSSGQIVGSYVDSLSDQHGFLYSGGAFTTIDVTFAGATTTTALGINDLGQIVGAWVDGSGIVHGFVDKAGTFTSIDDPNVAPCPSNICLISQLTAATGINRNGEIVGIWQDSGGVIHGFTLDPTLTTYMTVDEPNAATGQAGYGTVAWGVNDSGDIAGYYYDSGLAEHGFVYSNSSGNYQQVEIFGALGTFLFRIKNKGQLVGGFYDQFSEVHGATNF